jgi:hypothetical protein
LSTICEHGFKGDAAGGVIDRAGRRLLVFDVDGTRETLLQRELPDVDGKPAPRRRQLATARGYSGRKRSDAVMTRMVVQQSHTQEFLGSLPMPGNGHRLPMIQFAAAQIAHYARERSIPLGDCIVRSDGEHGMFSQVHPVTKEGLGFLSRCANYSFLNHPIVKAALAAGTTVCMTHPDSGMVREVFDVPAVPWQLLDDAPDVRLIVTRSKFPKERQHRVGHRIGDYVFECFVTNRPATSLHAADVVELYLHRGQFEAALAREDKELPTSHWASDELEGQRLWHLLAQWIWNIRIWLGAALLERTEFERCTDFTTKIDHLSSPSQVDIDALYRDAAIESGAAIMPAASVAATRSTDEQDPSAKLQDQTRPANEVESSPRVLRFVRDESGALRCPSGYRMTLSETRKRSKAVRERYRAARRDCARCEMRAACLGEGASQEKGRRIEIAANEQEVRVNAERGSKRTRLAVLSPVVPTNSRQAIKAAPTAAPAKGTSVLWMDIAAARARRTLYSALDALRVETSVEASVDASSPKPTSDRPISRNQRAHRRRSIQEHLCRNTADPSKRWTFRFRGIPARLAILLNIERLR